MFRYLFIFIVITLSACATTAGYEKVLNSWVGAQEIDLVRRWGPPVQSYETGGRKFIVYSSRRNVYLTLEIHYPKHPMYFYDLNSG